MNVRIKIFLMAVVTISASYASAIEREPGLSTGWWDTLAGASSWSRPTDSYAGALAALGALSVAGAASYGYYNYATYQAERLIALRELYVQLTGLLEYALNPLNPDKREVWVQWVNYPEVAFNQGMADIESNLGIRRGFFWGHSSTMSRNIRIVDNFKNQILYQKGLEEAAEKAGRSKPVPGRAFANAIKELVLLIASYLTQADVIDTIKLIAEGEKEAAEARSRQAANTATT